MTNKIAAMSFLLIITTNLHCQQMGFTIGITTSIFNNSAPFTKMGMGLDANLFNEKALPLNHCFIKTGIGYTQIRGNGTINYYNQINEVVLSYNKMQVLNYAQVPLLFKYNFSKSAKHKLGILGGVQYGLLFAGWHNPQTVNINHNVTKQFVRNILGGQLGLEYTKPLSGNLLLHIISSYRTSLTTIQ